MTRILMIETASPKRVRERAKGILAGSLYPQPDVTILCRPDPHSIECLQALEGVKVVPLEKARRRSILADLRRARFDVTCAFWTAEKKYRWMKLTALRLPAACREIDIGDGRSMELSWGNFRRFLSIRRKYPRPSDQDLYVSMPDSHDQGEATPGQNRGEKILIIQSAEAPYVLRALTRLKEANLFREPRYTLFCRNRPEVLRPLEGHPLLYRIITHSETRGAWHHLRQFRGERFDAVVALFTGDPSYWKIKYFAFLIGARHRLIFNEHNECFFFSWGKWVALMAHRLGNQSQVAPSPRWTHQARLLAILILKVLLLPFRFLWLLLVWIRLRNTGLGTTG